MTNVIPLRPFTADGLIDRLAELQRLFDGGEWSGDQALGYVDETGRIYAQLKEKFGLTELQIEQALWKRKNN